MNTMRGRLLALLLVGLAIVVLIGGAAVYWIARAGMLRQMDTELLARADHLAPLVAYETDRFEYEFDDWPAALLNDGLFEFRTRSGWLLRQSPSLGGASLPRHAPRGEEAIFGNVNLPGDVKGRAVWRAFLPRIDPPSAIGPDGLPIDDDDDLEDDDGVYGSPHKMEEIVVTVAINRTLTDRALTTLLVTLLIVGGGLMATVTGLVLLGVPWGLAPLERLGRQIESVGSRTLSKRFDEPDAPGELTPIYDELNRMLERLEQTVARERTFAAAAAHELRTPLAELRTTAEVAMRWSDPERSLAALREAIAIGGEMERMVEALLAISRGDAGVGESAVHVSLAPLVDTCLARSAATIERQGLAVKVDISESAALVAPREALEVVIRNLIDNAVQYTPHLGAISIHGSANGSAPSTLIVENGPVGLDAADLPRLFEPFWRKDAARGDREHAGLGLALVRQWAAAIGLNIEARLVQDRLQMRLAVRTQQ